MTKEGSLLLLAAKEPMFLGLLLLFFLLRPIATLAGLAIVNDGLLVGGLGGLGLDLAGFEDVAGAAPARMLSARAWSSGNTVTLQSVWVHRQGGRMSFPT